MHLDRGYLDIYISYHIQVLLHFIQMFWKQKLLEKKFNYDKKNSGHIFFKIKELFYYCLTFCKILDNRRSTSDDFSI